MSKINDYSENTTANESDLYIQETTSGPRKITFSTILNGIISKFLKSTQKSSLTATNKGTTSSREYAVGLDANGQMSVNVPWVDTNTVTPVVNNLTSTSTTSALSAAQGRYLKSLIDSSDPDISSEGVLTLSGGFTGGSAKYITYGKLVYIQFTCYYAGQLNASTDYKPFSGLPTPQKTYVDIKSAVNGAPFRVCVSSDAKLIVNPVNNIPANTYLAGTYIYFQS